ncbi:MULTISPECIES: prepilin peptidase [Pseudovibrio]|uniref:A24 family peptidase n=1 Tax=Stappiaceae TaxID=2821832 RepID=UPI00236701A0|nr:MULTISPECIES: prepilin peptidase [Pseudovibrio]MDD7910087.1 prepilin peptidase [Pseudovibrio exalbescens]MDX5592370.1 prepilin peptidase [Pseudovibrio sp. SPO723]
MLATALLVFFPFIMIYAAISDLFTMTIPNYISLALIAGFAVLAPLAGMSFETVGIHFATALIVLGAGFGLFALGVMGGGDAKFAACVALWLGFSVASVEFLLLMAIYGGVLTIAVLLFRSFPVLPLFMEKQTWISRLHNKKTGVPYGIAIAFAALQVYGTSAWFDQIAALSAL